MIEQNIQHTRQKSKALRVKFLDDQAFRLLFCVFVCGGGAGWG